MGALIADIAPYASIVALVGQVVFVWAMWSLKKTFVPAEAYTARATELDQRLAKLESKVDGLSLPDVHPLELAIKEVQGELKTMAKAMEMQSDAVRRIEENTAQGMGRIEKQVNMLMQHELRESR